MTGLETAFYIIGIIFMGLMLLFMIVVITAILVIRHKISHIQQQIEDRLHTAKDIAAKGEAVVKTIKKATRGRR